MASRAQVVHAEDEESYFVSMTDVVIGLLFIFIIMLMFFAMRFQEATQKQQEATQKRNEVTEKQSELINDLTDAETARNVILRDIGNLLQKNKIEVLIVQDEGILRFSEEILFEKASWELNSKKGVGVEALKTLGEALDQVLPCYTTGPRSGKDNCPKTKSKIEAIFIEGHADSDAYHPTVPTEQRRGGAGNSWQTAPESSIRSASPLQPFLGGQVQEPRRAFTLRASRDNHPPKDNLDLSALRATTTYRELLRVKPELGQFKSPNNTPVLSVSGYGQDRQLLRKPDESDVDYKKRNRRIDLRLIMATPRSKDARQMQQDIDRQGRANEPQ
jgi:chemotaxis protein MotB